MFRSVSVSALGLLSRVITAQAGKGYIRMAARGAM